jgi:hypothetical protein
MVSEAWLVVIAAIGSGGLVGFLQYWRQRTKDEIASSADVISAVASLSDTLYHQMSERLLILQTRIDECDKERLALDAKVKMLEATVRALSADR